MPCPRVAVQKEERTTRELLVLRSDADAVFVQATTNHGSCRRAPASALKPMCLFWCNNTGGGTPATRSLGSLPAAGSWFYSTRVFLCLRDAPSRVFCLCGGLSLVLCAYPVIPVTTRSRDEILDNISRMCPIFTRAFTRTIKKYFLN